MLELLFKHGVREHSVGVVLFRQMASVLDLEIFRSGAELNPAIPRALALGSNSA
jgi:hypothetical protein